MSSPNALSAAANAAEERRGVAAAAVVLLAAASAPLAMLTAGHPAEVAAGALVILVVVVCLARVELAILLLVASSPLEGAFQFGSGGVTFTKLAGALCFTSFALHALSTHRRIVFDRTHAFVFGILALALVSTLWAENLGVAQSTTVRYASFAALYVIVSQFSGSHGLYRRIAWVLSASCAVTGVLAIGNLLNGSSPQAAVPFTNQNDTAFILATALPLTFWLLRERGIRGMAALAMLGVISAAIVLTFSRGALVGLAAFALWQIFIQRRRVIVLVLGIAVAAAVTYGFVHSNQQEVERGFTDKQKVASTNVSTRVEAWQAATKLIEAYPVLGVGPGNFREHYFEATGRPPGTENLLLVHNAYLDVATELGVLAGLLFLAYVVTVLLRAAGANRKRAGPPGFAAAVEGALVIGIISSFFLSEQYFAPLWLLGALATALWREDPATDSPPATP